MSIEQKEITPEIQESFDKFKKERDFTDTATNFEYLNFELRKSERNKQTMLLLYAAGFHAGKK